MDGKERPDSRTSESHVVTWFPPDKPIRHVSKRSFEDAQAYIEENELEGFAPMIERVLITVIEEREIVWNSADQSRRVEPQGPNAGLEAWADRYMAERGIEPTPEGQSLADRVARGEA